MRSDSPAWSDPYQIVAGDVLGAVLAGGRSRRFGSDKAVALALDKPLISHAIDALRAIHLAVVICGCEWKPHVCLTDRAQGGQGPLAGLNSALHHARNSGVSWVLSLPCDAPFVALGTLEQLARSAEASFMESQPVMGLWPSSEADQLDEWLAVEADNSMRAWANSIFALPRFRGIGVVNFYYTDELATWISALNREES